ncbi:TPA: phosphoheptose isomerase [bacterium]|nr:phosphoheptose isomerase [bacterium]
MKNLAEEYYKEIEGLLKSIKVTDMQGNKIDFYIAVASTCSMIEKMAENKGKLIFIGNGGSAAMSSHFATDFWKNGGIRAVAFNDSSLLTCISNDFAYKHVFEKPIEMFAEDGDILFAISSSGRSENILLGVDAARKKHLGVITLSGFRDDNPLRRLGDINFYVPSQAYEPVEDIHHSICHCIVNVIIKRTK